MSDNGVVKFFLRFYMIVLLGFLLFPLVIVAGAALNDSAFPSVWPWRGFTTRWFVDLWNNGRFWVAAGNTMLVAFGVMVLSVPIGAAAAIILNSTYGKTKSFLYAVATAPILTPGAVVGISTLLFWRNLDIPSGLFITMLGQVSIIAAYVMLLVLARLQSFDGSLEEAALDLGASHLKVVWLILLPHLRPSLMLGAVISFLQSLESFNVPLFTRGKQETVMIYIASQVRVGVTPMINAFALILIVVAIIAGVGIELNRRRTAKIRDRDALTAFLATAGEEVVLVQRAKI